MREYILRKADKKIEIEFYNEKINIPEEIKKQIDAYWEKRITLHPFLRRGDTCTITEIVENKEKIHLKVKKSDYAHYLYTKNCEIEDLYAAKDIWSGILVETRDNKFVIGRKAENTATPFELEVSGGGVEKEEIEQGEEGLKTAAIRELQEEMGITINNIEISHIEMQGLDNSFGVIYKGKIDKTEKELEAHFKKYTENLKKEKKEIELDKLYYIEKEKEKIEEFLNNFPNSVTLYLKQLLLENIE